MYVVTFSDSTEIGVQLRRAPKRRGIWEATLSTGESFLLAIKGRNDSGYYVVELNGIDHIVALKHLEGNLTQLTSDIATSQDTMSQHAYVDHVVVSRAAEVVFHEQKHTPTDAPIDTSAPLPFTSPITGILLDVFVTPGQAVKKGDPLVLIEAMKMENTMVATADQTVSQVHIKPNDTVFVGDTLISFSPSNSSPSDSSPNLQS